MGDLRSLYGTAWTNGGNGGPGLEREDDNYVQVFARVIYRNGIIDTECQGYRYKRRTVAVGSL